VENFVENVENSWLFTGILAVQKTPACGEKKMDSVRKMEQAGKRANDEWSA
jgi:hypothetical protein